MERDAKREPDQQLRQVQVRRTQRPSASAYRLASVHDHVRSDDADLPVEQLVKQLDEDLYGMVYSGYLESMFACVGGEALYRPMGERWAVGVDMNWVKQRDFDQGLGLRDYSTITGNATLYYRSSFQDILGALSVGRYLAKDYGATLDLPREFSNGVRFGGWVTITNATKRNTVRVVSAKVFISRYRSTN